MFFEAGPRFGVKVISRLTQPQNRKDEPITPDYFRAHCFELQFRFTFEFAFILFVGLLNNVQTLQGRN